MITNRRERKRVTMEDAYRNGNGAIKTCLGPNFALPWQGGWVMHLPTKMVHASETRVEELPDDLDVRLER